MTVPTLAPAARDLSPLASPLGPAYARLNEVFPALRVTETTPGGALPEGEGWVRASELAEGGEALARFLSWDDEQIRRDYGGAGRPDVVAGFGLHRYAWPVCLLVTMPWFLHRRVPRIPVEDVAFQRSLGRLAVRTGTFACLPDDPAAGALGAPPAAQQLGGARVVPDEEALRAEVREAVAAHLEPVLAGFGPRMRRGTRALWGMASDEITEGLWYLGQLLGEEERAMREAGELLPGRLAPFAQGAGFRELTGPGGESLATRDRASCCLFYTLRPEDTCVTCPRTCDAERIERLTTAR